MTTQDISQISTKTFSEDAKKLTTTFDFYFRQGGVRYYIDYISSDLLLLRLRNSRTGEGRIELMHDILTGRSRNTFFFSK